jgi:hypothetical protein
VNKQTLRKFRKSHWGPVYPLVSFTLGHTLNVIKGTWSECIVFPNAAQRDRRVNLRATAQRPIYAIAPQITFSLS